MSRVLSTIWKTLVIWPAFCGLLIAIFSVYDAIQNGRLGKFIADPDLLMIPIFAYLMFWIPALVTAMVFCLIGVWRKNLPIWSVPISALLAFLVFYYYEYSSQPYFKSGITEDNLFLVDAAVISAACSFVVWRRVRKHWNQRATA